MHCFWKSHAVFLKSFWLPTFCCKTFERSFLKCFLSLGSVGFGFIISLLDTKYIISCVLLSWLAYGFLVELSILLFLNSVDHSVHTLEFSNAECCIWLNLSVPAQYLLFYKCHQLFTNIYTRY